MIGVRPCVADDIPAVVSIVRNLPDYFGADVPGEVEHDAAVHDAWVLAEGAAVVGFVVVERKGQGAAEIRWIAIDPARRGRGLGSALLDEVLRRVGEEGVGLVEAKTLDRSAGSAAHEATRSFWERNGFVQVDTVDEPPGRLPGNPAAIYVAALRPTR